MVKPEEEGLQVGTYRHFMVIGSISLFGTIAQYLLNEAIIHGKAKNVQIKAFAYERSFTIEVVDDGPSDVYTKGSGLGTLLFDTFTQDWSIGREADKTVVRFSILRK
jgi:anti-sigma regulatory factor (Ser/Thr protein kinase)